jgi:hypothetical protein
VEHFQNWQDSGLIQRQYCQLHGINPHSFSSRLSVYRKEQGVEQPRSQPLQFKALVPVNVVQAPPQDRLLIQIRQHQLQIPMTVSPAWLAELMQCLA